MAFNFDSGQFNKEASPKRLGNWQVPRWAPTRPRPVEMRPEPKPICDINGRFLPGAPRGTSRCFGHYTGTWDLPRKITRKVAEELAKEPPDSRFSDWLHPRVQRPKAAAAADTRTRSGKRGKEDDHPTKSEEQTFKPSLCPVHFRRAKEKLMFEIGDSHINLHQVETEQDCQIYEEHKEDYIKKNKDNNDPLDLYYKNDAVDDEGNGPYIPGSLTDPDKRHESYQKLVNDAIEEVHGPQEAEGNKFWRKVAENATSNDQVQERTMKYTRGETPKLPSVNITKNFHFARKMHAGNLEHQPLPDTLGYRHLTKIGEHRDSDIIVKPYAIGWKGYGASGPTSCTKMRVHRPKTCDATKTENPKNDNQQRPLTSGPNLSTSYQKPLSLMDLAICWDVRLVEPKNEPKPPKHIDGSNGSRAPAVFTMVRTPKDETKESQNVSHTNPIFNQNRTEEDEGRHPVPYFEKDMTKEKKKNSCDVQNCPQHTNTGKTRSNSGNSSRKGSAQSFSKADCDGVHGCGTPSESSRKCSRDNQRSEKLHPIKQAWEDKMHSNGSLQSLESYSRTPLAQGKLHQSSPNESQVLMHSNKESTDSNGNIKHKHCSSCNGNKIPPETKQKDEYKLAFKAGNPNSVKSNTSTDSKEIKMPKMRHPYAKKSYTIPTLAPPFSIWRDANTTGYPEHWRLASVYQHAYKPLEQRRKPLIASVYQ